MPETTTDTVTGEGVAVDLVDTDCLHRSLKYKILNLDKGVTVLYFYLLIIPNDIDLTLD